MRDFPVFTTENGVGSLVLKEIPYSGIAYVTVRDSSLPTEFLNECVDFCRAVGAMQVFATGSDTLENYPLHAAVIRMRASWEQIPKTEACLFPVTEQTVSCFREIYNDKMRYVDHAAFLSEKAAKELLVRGGGYFVHTNGQLLGIGIAADDRIECVASLVKGAGKDVVSALKNALISDCVVLDVASTNHKAIRLYESLGFVKSAEISRWYKLF